jgi:hypothetical protein
MLSIILKARLQFYANKNCIITAILNEKKYQNKLKLIAPPIIQANVGHISSPDSIY